LLTKSLQLAVDLGTGRSLKQILPVDANIAGKTGTTDDLRDSWFAGFSGNYVGVVWVGSDDNKNTGLTGASGALRIWGHTLSSFPIAPLTPVMPDNLVYLNTSIISGERIGQRCADGIELPFVIGYEPQQEFSCSGEQKPSGGVRNWFDRLLNR
jgi:penicillin-binding protein 1B